MTRLGTHEGVWLKGSDVKSQFHQMNEEGDMEEVNLEQVIEGSFLERNGIWFEVFLLDDPRKRYFLEVVS